LKLRKACGFDGIPDKCLRHLPRRPLVHLTCYVITVAGLVTKLSLKEAKDLTF
jgi:hypothetical protein